MSQSYYEPKSKSKRKRHAQNKSSDRLKMHTWILPSVVSSFQIFCFSEHSNTNSLSKLYFTETPTSGTCCCFMNSFRVIPFCLPNGLKLQPTIQKSFCLSFWLFIYFCIPTFTSFFWYIFIEVYFVYNILLVSRIQNSDFLQLYTLLKWSPQLVPTFTSSKFACRFWEHQVPRPWDIFVVLIPRGCLTNKGSCGPALPGRAERVETPEGNWCHWFFKSANPPRRAARDTSTVTNGL